MKLEKKRQLAMHRHLRPSFPSVVLRINHEARSDRRWTYVPNFSEMTTCLKKSKEKRKPWQYIPYKC